MTRNTGLQNKQIKHSKKNPKIILAISHEHILLGQKRKINRNTLGNSSFYNTKSQAIISNEVKHKI